MEDTPPARVLLSDQSYNVKISGHVTGGAHRKFVMASGEITDEQFLSFNIGWMATAPYHVCDGGVLGTFIDWRGYPTVYTAASKLDLKPINLVVWSKTSAGMGSLYRSQHELFAVQTGRRPAREQFELGKNGRWRLNVRTYAGASTIGSDARQGLQDHPTVKPAAMLMDALLDLTNRGDIVLDPFLGSGSTLIAAERTSRVCHGVELDPLYVHVIIRRLVGETGQSAVLEETGESFAELSERCAAEVVCNSTAKI